MTQIWAHRGASAQRPENTLSAFERAFELGADGVELDVQLTSDGQTVVIHDETLERTSDGHGWVGEHSLAQLREFDFSKPHPEHGPAQIPLLSEVLELARSQQKIVNIELKNSEVAYPGLEEAVVGIVDDLGMAELVWYSSFNHLSVARLQGMGSPTGVLAVEPLFEPWQYAASMGAGALHPYVQSMALAGIPEFVQNAHEAGIAVHPWTVDDPDLMEQLADAGTDAIITNVPDVALDLLA